MTAECVEDILSEFHVDPKLGFVLPDPLTRLPDVFKPWQDIVDALPELLESQTIEQRIDALPIIDTTQLKSNKELRLAHLLLVTLSSAYVWNRGSDKPHLSIPRQISQPLIDVSDRTGLKPIVVHASACLANWKRRCNTESKCGIADEHSELFRAEDVSLIAFRFTTHPGNEWFFTLTAQMETEFAPGLMAVARACFESRLSPNTFTDIQLSLNTASATFRRMKERLPPNVFYNGFRKFLSGYTHGEFAKQGGVIFEGFEDRGAQPLNGGSAAQSSALHVFDAFLGVVHDGDEGDYLQTQWDYMPPEHRNFIKWVRKRAIQLIPTIQQAAEYQKTIETLKHFRCEHIKVVTSYIVVPSSANKPGVGTGGTSFMKLLKKIRDDCLSH